VILRHPGNPLVAGGRGGDDDLKSTTNLLPAYNSLMDGLDQQSSGREERDSSRMIIMIAVVVVIGAALAAAFLLRISEVQDIIDVFRRKVRKL